MKWSKERIKGCFIGEREASYEALVTTPEMEKVKKLKPEIFNFEAMSIGDNYGQLCIIPLDDADKDTAEFILRALLAYEGD